MSRGEDGVGKDGWPASPAVNLASPQGRDGCRRDFFGVPVIAGWQAPSEAATAGEATTRMAASMAASRTVYA